MLLLDKLKKYEKKAWYISSGADFYIIEELYNNKIETDLIIMSDIYPESFLNLDDLFSLKKTNLSDNIVHNYKINIKYIEELENINLIVNPALYFRLSKYNNKVLYLNIDYTSKSLNINKDIIFIVSENITLGINYFIKNNMNIDYIYSHGIRGSNINMSSISYLFDKLSTKLFITNDIYLPFRSDEKTIEVFNDLKYYNKLNLKEEFCSIYGEHYFKVLKSKDKYIYPSVSFKEYKYLIDHNIFTIDLSLYNSKFGQDTFINGIKFKKNSNLNVIGLDIILNLGANVTKDYVIFEDLNFKGQVYQVINSYRDKYLTLDNKLVLNIDKDIPQSLLDIDIYEKIIINNEFKINTKFNLEVKK